MRGESKQARLTHPTWLESPVVPKDAPLAKDGRCAAISRPHIAPAAPIREGSARDMSRTGVKGLSKRPSNRPPIPVSPSSPVAPMPLIIRSYLFSGRGTSRQRTRAFLMAHLASGFSTSYLPPARQTQTPCSCRSRLWPSLGWVG